MIRKYFATDFTVGGRVELDAAGGIKSMKELKQSIKDAQLDLINMQERFGETSKEAINAARRVNELKDKIKDAAEVTDLFDPGKKFQAATNAINGLVGGFTALTGAMSLLGVESDNVQKQLLKVQSALALSQGLSTIADSAKDFKRLGDTIVNTLGRNGAIGLAIAGVGALALAISGVFSRNKELTEATNAYTQSAMQARTEVAKLKGVFDQAKAGVISKEEALKTYNEGMGQTVGQAQSLNEAESLLVENAQKYVEVQGLKAKANYLLQESAKLAAQAETARDELATTNLTGFLRSTVESKIADLDAKAKRLEGLVDGVNQQINAASAGFRQPGGSSGGGGGGRTQPAADPNAVNFGQGEFDSDGLSVQQRLDLAAEKKFREQRNKLLNSFEANRFKMIQDFQNMEKQEMLDSVNALVDATDKKILLAEQERQARVQAAFAIGNALGTLSDMVGKQTAAGKVLGIAQATINTFIGATEVLRQKSTLPEPFATISKIANVAAIIGSGIAAVKNIVKVQVPGQAGGGSVPSGVSANAPLQPQQQAFNTNTILNQNQLNQIGNAAVRAFVVESDVTNNQERIRMLNRRARL